MAWYGRWKPYVPVARRRAQATVYAAQLAKKQKRALLPVKVGGRNIAASFWGRAWCENLECYSDFANRLPRGRTYVRNGSVIDLVIEKGVVKALVSGSEIYNVTIKIKTLASADWKQVKADCAQSIGSLIDLLQGRFDQGIMQRLARREGGLFPQPKAISMSCSCPDWATMCKHVAAVLYGVGARLDSAPEMLFTLRGVDHFELIGQAVASDNLNQALAGEQEAALTDSDLSELFGIDIDAAASAQSASPKSASPKKARQRRLDKPQPAAKKPRQPMAAKPSTPQKAEAVKERRAAKRAPSSGSAAAPPRQVRTRSAK